MLYLLSGAALLAGAYTRPVTAVCTYGGAVIVGRKDGAVEQLGQELDLEANLANAGGAPVSFIAASPIGTAWLSGEGGVIRDKVAPPKPSAQVLSILVGDKRVTVKIQPSAPVRRLGWLGGRIVVSYDFGAAFFDQKGRAVSATSFMPAEVAALVPGSSLWIRELGDGTEFALFAKPHSVRQNSLNQREPLVSLFTGYEVGAWQWERVGGFASTAFDAFPEGELQANEEGRISSDARFLVLSDRVGLAEDGVIAREQDSLLTAPIFMKDWESFRVPAPAVPGDALWFGAESADGWWWNGSAVVRQNRKTGGATAFLPWGSDDLRPTSFAADQTGLWVGSNRGLTHLGAAKGGDGFVAVALSKESVPADPRAKALTDAVFAWRFADADKAGSDGAIMIASVFSVLGKRLPQTASELLLAGAPVSDEIRYGDVIVTSKSAAIYLGNGSTVEVRGGRVQNGEIWSFGHASVRRFLD